MIAKQSGSLDHRSLRSKDSQPNMLFYASAGYGTVKPACPDTTPEYAKVGLSLRAPRL